MPPPHDQMILFSSETERIMLMTPASTSAGVPIASTSLGGRLPSRSYFSYYLYPSSAIAGVDRPRPVRTMTVRIPAFMVAPVCRP